jgi:hypothetical protein
LTDISDTFPRYAVSSALFPPFTCLPDKACKHAANSWQNSVCQQQTRRHAKT